MPSRWWIPLTKLDPRKVKPEYVHAVASSWFDDDDDDHQAQAKPYAISPLGSAPDGAGCGFEVGVLTDAAEARLVGATGSDVRLGGQSATVGDPELLRTESWSALERPSGARGWLLDFRTPATFRQGQRSSPFPAPPSVLRGLRDSWNACCDGPPRVITPQETNAVWVADLDGAGEPVSVARADYVGFVGWVEYQCSDQAVAEVVDGWFRLAAYCGVGSAKIKGLGVTEVTLLGLDADPRRS